MRNYFEIKGNIVEIECKRNNGETVTTHISSEDFEKVSKVQTTWFVHTDNKSGKMYVRGNVKDDEGNRKIALLHRVVTDCPNELVVNHISGDTLDNTRENLEATTHRENIVHGKELVEVFVRKSKVFPNISGGFYDVVWIIDNELEFFASVHTTKSEALIRKYILEIRQKPTLLKYKDYPVLFKELGYDFQKLPYETWFGEIVPKLLTGKEIRQQLKVKEGDK